METKLTFHTSVEWDESAEEKVVDGISNLQEKIEKAWSDPLATLEKHVSDNLTELGKAWGKTLEKGWTDSASTLGTAITDSISPFFDGEMDKVGDIWAKAWNDMGNVLDSVLKGMIKDIFTQFGKYMGDVLNDLVVAPIADWLGIKNGLGDLVKPVSSTLYTGIPTQLILFKTSHDTTFNQAEGKTNTAYTKMGLAAHDFFDDVGFQASQVLGGLVTGEVNSLDNAWIIDPA